MASNQTGARDEGSVDKRRGFAGPGPAQRSRFSKPEVEGGFGRRISQRHRRESRIKVKAEGGRKVKRSPRNGDGAYVVSVSGRIMITRRELLLGLLG